MTPILSSCPLERFQLQNVCPRAPWQPSNDQPSPDENLWANVSFPAAGVAFLPAWSRLWASQPGMSRAIPWPVSGAAVALAVAAGRVSVVELKKAGAGRYQAGSDPHSLTKAGRDC